MKEHSTAKTMHFLKSYFFKLSLIYSVTAAVLFWVLATVIADSYTEVLFNKELQFEQLIVSNINQYLDEQEENSKSIIKTMYMMDGDMPARLRRLLSNTGTDIQQYSEDHADVSSYMNSFILDNKSIVNIVLFDINGKSINFTNNFNIKYENVNFDHVLQDNMVSKNETFQLIPTYESPYNHSDYGYIYSYHTSLFDPNKTYERIGSIIINHYVDDIYDIYDDYIENILGSILVMDKQEQIIYDSTGDHYLKEHPLSQPILENDTETLNAHGFHIVSGLKSNSNFVVVSIIPKDKLRLKYQGITNTITFILFVMIAVLSIATFFLFSIFRKKINRVRLAMRKMQEGEIGTMIPLSKSDDEVDQISKGFNTMSQRLEEYINKVYISELKTKKAELVTLQYQINPHFLYNTLESFRMIALKSNNTLLSDMILSLSKLLRKSANTTSILWSIKDEIEYSTAYLELYKIRYPDRLITRINIMPDLMTHNIPKFVIQPILENTIKYCLVPTDLTLKIKIDTKVQGDCIFVTIRDNGIGISPEALDEINGNLSDHSELPTSHIGLKNINDRIRLLFGDDYGLAIESTIGIDTCVTLKLPLMVDADNSQKDIPLGALLKKKGADQTHV